MNLLWGGGSRPSAYDSKIAWHEYPFTFTINMSDCPGSMKYNFWISSNCSCRLQPNISDRCPCISCNGEGVSRSAGSLHNSHCGGETDTRVRCRECRLRLFRLGRSQITLVPSGGLFNFQNSSLQWIYDIPRINREATDHNRSFFIHLFLLLSKSTKKKIKAQWQRRIVLNMTQNTFLALSSESASTHQCYSIEFPMFHWAPKMVRTLKHSFMNDVRSSLLVDNYKQCYSLPECRAQHRTFVSWANH